MFYKPQHSWIIRLESVDLPTRSSSVCRTRSRRERTKARRAAPIAPKKPRRPPKIGPRRLFGMPMLFWQELTVILIPWVLNVEFALKKAANLIERERWKDNQLESHLNENEYALKIKKQVGELPLLYMFGWISREHCSLKILAWLVCILLQPPTAYNAFQILGAILSGAARRHADYLTNFKSLQILGGCQWGMRDGSPRSGLLCVCMSRWAVSSDFDLWPLRLQLRIWQVSWGYVPIHQTRIFSNSVLCPIITGCRSATVEIYPPSYSRIRCHVLHSF